MLCALQVDICLYLLPPRELAAADAAFVRRLSAHVAVLPVLARADALPALEVSAVRDAAAAELYKDSAATGAHCGWCKSLTWSIVEATTLCTIIFNIRT